MGSVQMWCWKKGGGPAPTERLGVASGQERALHMQRQHRQQPADSTNDRLRTKRAVEDMSTMIGEADNDLQPDQFGI